MKFIVEPVNDTFVMNAWAEVLKIKKRKSYSDGSGNFTRYMGMLIGKKIIGVLASLGDICVLLTTV